MRFLDDAVASSPVLEGPYVFRRLIGETLPRFATGPGDVGREEDFSAQTACQEWMRARRRLLSEHVGGVTGQPVFRQGPGHRLFVDDRPASQVQKKGFRLHPGERSPINKVARGLRQGA